MSLRPADSYNPPEAALNQATIIAAVAYGSLANALI